MSDTDPTGNLPMPDGDVGEAMVDDRRSLLKKAAIVGGAAWVAPMILSEAAMAQSTGVTPPVTCTVVSLGAPINVKCGTISVSNPTVGIWLILGTPNGPGPAPIISNVTVTNVTSANVNGVGTSAVTVQVLPNAAIPVLCVDFVC